GRGGSGRGDGHSREAEQYRAEPAADHKAHRFSVCIFDAYRAAWASVPAGSHGSPYLRADRDRARAPAWRGRRFRRAAPAADGQAADTMTSQHLARDGKAGYRRYSPLAPLREWPAVAVSCQAQGG